VPSLGTTITHTGSSLPWAWFIAFALVDLLLLALVLVRRRRAGAGRS
jgi:Na+/H+ antiporter NhaC